MRTTHTYALMEVSPTVFEEIRQKLKEAGYDHAIDTERGEKTKLIMQGIALISAEPSENAALNIEAKTQDAPYGWVCYNCGPCSWTWFATRQECDHELTDEKTIRPATALEHLLFKQLHVQCVGAETIIKYRDEIEPQEDELPTGNDPDTNWRVYRIHRDLLPQTKSEKTKAWRNREISRIETIFPEFIERYKAANGQ